VTSPFLAGFHPAGTAVRNPASAPDSAAGSVYQLYPAGRVACAGALTCALAEAGLVA
jgi:hypothetical protein